MPKSLTPFTQLLSAPNVRAVRRGVVCFYGFSLVNVFFDDGTDCVGRSRVLDFFVIPDAA